MGGGAPVADGVGEDVQVMREFGGVRFSVGVEARGRRGRRGRGGGARCSGGARGVGAASVDDKDDQKHVKRFVRSG